MKYKIGQILTCTKDVVVEKAFSGEKITIPKGNRIIAEYILICLRAHFPVDDWMEEYGISEDEIVEEIEFALDEIGMC